MALPTYKKQTQQVASARQTAGGTSTAGFQASAQASQSLAQKLSSFSQQTQAIAGGMAQTQASKDAVRDIYTRKQKIAEINNDPNMYAGDKQNKIAEITEGAERDFSGIYSKAYNSAANAAYSNQITSDAKAASDQAQLKSGGDSESYAKQMREFRDKTIPEAPTKETAIVAEMAIAQYGGQGYKALKLAEIRKDEINRNNKFKSTSQLQSTDIMANLQEGDFINATQNMFKLEQTLEDGVKNGWMNEEDATMIRLEVSEKGVLAYAKDRIALMETIDAQKFIDDFREGNSEMPTEFLYVDTEKVADRMEYLLDRETRKRDNAIKAKAAKDYDDVKDTIYLLDQGEEVSSYKLQADYNKNIKPETRLKLEQAMNDNGYMKVFDSKNLTEQSEIIADIRDKENKTAGEYRLQQKYEKHYAQGQKAIDNDPLQYSQGKAFDQELEPINLQDGDLLAKSEKRLQQVELSKEYTNRRVGFFTKDEVTTIKSQLEGMTPQEQIGVMEMVNQLPSDIRDNTYRQFNNSFSFSGGLVASGNTEAARTSLLGKGADVKLPQGFKEDVGLKISNAFGGFDGEFYTQNVKGLTDYAKGLIKGGDADDINDINQMVKDSIGEIAKYNSKATVIPYGVEKKDFEKWLDNIQIEGRPGLTKGLQDMTDIFGHGDYQLHYAGSAGKYYVKFGNDGNMSTARDSNDPTRPFILDWNDK